MTPAKPCSTWTLLSLRGRVAYRASNIRYAVSELQKDVEKELLQLPEAEREAKRTEFAIFVVHNKLKEKLGTLPPSLP